MPPSGGSRSPRSTKSRRGGGGAVTLSNVSNPDAVSEHVMLMGNSSVNISQSEQSPSASVASHAKRRGFGLRGFVFGSTVATSLLLLVMAVYYAIVMLNLVFVFDAEFEHSDVPFYITPNSTAGWKHADRLGIWWWLVALSLLRIGSVVGTNMALSNAALTGQDGPLSLMRAWTILYGLADFGIAMFFIITAYSRLCAEAPVCRNWSATQGIDLPSDGDANWVFLLLTWFSVAFALVHIALYILLGNAIKRLGRVNSAMEVEEDVKGV